MKKVSNSLKTMRQRGVTLLEVLLSLGVIAIIIISAIIFYNSASGQNKVNDAVTQIQAYTTGLKSLYSSQPNYGTGDMVIAAINGGVAPSNAISGTALMNPWGLPTRIIGNTSSFQIRMVGVPRDACTKILLSGLLSTNMHSIWVQTGTTSPAATALATGAATFTNASKPNPTTAATACGTDSDDVNLMTFAVR